MLATKRLASDDIAEAARLLRAGRLIAFPTETVYGLGADARDDRAVAQIFAAKARPSFNPLIVHLPSLEAVGRYADLPPELVRLAEVHWPGPLSLVAPARGGLSKLVTAGLPSVALRVPADPLAQELLRAVDGPVAAPSANPSGRVSPTTADHVLSGLAGRIDAVLDGGPCGVGLESTIVGMEAGQPVLLRAGGIPTDALAETYGSPVLPRQGDSVTAPGQLESHYAPRATLRL
ncbi:MAG: L-threonylcarbamoyladenylate synthase, partial [Pseudomonadota bacterium]